MAEGIDLSHLDEDHLKKFVNDGTNGIQAFIDALGNLQKTDKIPAGLWTMLRLSSALTQKGVYFAEGPQLGKLAVSDEDMKTPISAVAFMKYISDSATSLNGIIEDQGTLFGDIKKALLATIKDMAETQQGTLDDIKGQDLLNDWKQIDKDLSPKPQGTNTGT
ncbi:type VII secretion system-associated protein [Streptomyces sp. NBC_01618]|uniref:type VII secretion system-associated protein n=1 Tax=Streptomyces sp. NBC_01618 TaxID=2975900 RepID=UPI003869F392|nr:type VII secretion system-associated protein [Streptomyces sp. NBC_01618]